MRQPSQGRTRRGTDEGKNGEGGLVKGRVGETTKGFTEKHGVLGKATRKVHQNL
jgi:hypothetical protein